MYCVLLTKWGSVDVNTLKKSLLVKNQRFVLRFAVFFVPLHIKNRI